MIYFDHNATTPVDPEVMVVVQEALAQYWGNPSSIHRVGQKAFAELEKARERFAELLAVSAQEIVFTSGGTESDNMAMLGSFSATPGDSVIISSIEHPAIKGAAKKLETIGVEIRIVPVDQDGRVALSSLEQLIDDSTRLISIMSANNEIGTVQPVNEIGAIAEKRGICFHSDAVQAFGKVPIQIRESGFSLVSLSSHKIYGPKGCGALFVKQGAPLTARTYGGSQEFKMRTGTQNIPAILGFVKAAELAIEKMESEGKTLIALTELLYEELVKTVDGVVRNGDSIHRLPGTLNVSFPGASSEIVVPALDRMGICVSGGAACASGATEPSATLMALGKNREEGVSAIRFSLGRSSTEEEIFIVVKAVNEVVSRIRGK